MDLDSSQFLACGVDLVEIPSIARSIELGGEAFLQSVYTEQELAFCGGRLPQLAARFAAKEAISKALGTGIRGVGLPEMEIESEPGGRPRVRLYGRAAARAEQLGLDQWTVSLTHSDTIAIAFVVATVYMGSASPAASTGLT